MNNKKRIIFSTVLTILICMLTVFVMSGFSTGFETLVYENTTKYMNNTLTTIVKIITHLGGPISLTAICLFLVIYKKTRQKVGIPVSICTITSQILNIILKNIFSRERPDFIHLVSETGYSFPSGHSMTNAAFYTMLIFITIKYVKNEKLKNMLVILFSLIPFSIGITRIYLGVHYAVDVLVGLLCGILTAIIVDLVLEILYKKNIDKIEKNNK